MNNKHVIVLIASVLFFGCKDSSKEQAPVANQNTATEQDNTGTVASDVAVTPIHTKPTEGSLASNSAKKSYIQSRLGQVLFEIDGNRIRSRMGQIMYEIDGNRIKARSGQTVCTIDGNRIRSRMGQTIFTMKGGVPLKTIALLIGAGALNLDQ